MKKQNMRIVFIVFVLTAQSLTASGQSFEQTYERALLDSAYRYELLKPVVFNLKSAYEYQTREITELKMQNGSLRMSATVREKDFAKQLAGEKRKRWRWTAFGFSAGVLIRILTH